MFGTAMGSLISPIVANLCMENLEKRAIVSAPEDCKLKFCKSSVDDTVEIIKRGSAKKLTSHLNSRSHGDSKVHLCGRRRGFNTFLRHPDSETKRWKLGVGGVLEEDTS